MAPGRGAHAALGLAAASVFACALMLAPRGLPIAALSMPGAGAGASRAEDRVFGQIESMNHRLRSENENLHRLLQRDETADIHVETRLQREDARKSARLRKEMQREERLRAELDTVLGKTGQGAAADVVASGEAAAGRRVREQSEVQSLLDAAKAQADQRLGLSDDADVERAYAADVDTALGPQESAAAADASQRPGGAEGRRARLSARQRRYCRPSQTATRRMHRTHRTHDAHHTHHTRHTHHTHHTHECFVEVWMHLRVHACRVCMDARVGECVCVRRGRPRVCSRTHTCRKYGAQASATTRAARIRRRNARGGSGAAARPPAPVTPRVASRPQRSRGGGEIAGVRG